MTSNTLQYWQDASADINGMLGGVPEWKGFGSMSRIDLQGSRTFLARLGIGSKSDRKSVKYAVDAGAGIGRITDGLLLKVAEQVDLVEPVQKHTDVMKGRAGVRKIFNVGLEDWHPDVNDVQYDLVWTQWCLCYLTDEQVVSYLQRCKTVLAAEGTMVVKENLTNMEGGWFDESDSSTTREEDKFKELFARAGLKIIKSELQRGVPETATARLLPIRMWALKPDPKASTGENKRKLEGEGQTSASKKTASV